LTEWVQDAWIAASLIVGSPSIRAGTLLLALITRRCFSASVARTLAERCTNVQNGARNIDFMLRKSLTPQLSDVLLAAMAEQRVLAYISVDLDASGGWRIDALDS